MVRLDEASCVSDGPKLTLSEAIEDLNYDLRIDPNLETLKFTGVCKVQFKAKKNFRYMFVHMKLIELSGPVVINE